MDISYDGINVSGGGINGLAYIGTILILYEKGLINRNMKLYCSKDMMEIFENTIQDKELITTLKIMHTNGLQTHQII